MRLDLKNARDSRSLVPAPAVSILVLCCCCLRAVSRSFLSIGGSGLEMSFFQATSWDIIFIALALVFCCFDSAPCLESLPSFS